MLIMMKKEEISIESPLISQFGRCETRGSTLLLNPTLQNGWLLETCDSHLHLADCPDIPGLLEFTRGVGMKVWSNSTSLEDGRTNLELKRRFPQRMEAFVGIHPSRANEGVDAGKLEPLVKRAAGVGEAGLDPKYSTISAEGAQLRLFREQLELAERFEKPIQVHSRGAEMACLDCVDSFDPPTVLLHWFEGAELASRAA